MADELRIDSRPSLDRPVMIAAFRGWNDGGQGASLAAAYLARAWAAQEFASIDPESFYDFQATRPTVSLVDGYTRRIDWPENTFMHAPLPGARRDAIIMLGVEPNLRWRTFSELVAGLARSFEVELVVTLGSLLADVPHTRPAPVTGSASDPDLINELGLQASRYEGPTGMVGVLHDACAQAGLKSASLWAAVPHYVSLTPSPRAAKALVDRLAELLGADVDSAELDEAADVVRAAGQRGGCERRGDGRVRAGARAARRRARGARRDPVGRLDRRRADALPARAGPAARRRRRSRAASRT